LNDRWKLEPYSLVEKQIIYDNGLFEMYDQDDNEYEQLTMIEILWGCRGL
jgi:hypothetical protein